MAGIETSPIVTKGVTDALNLANRTHDVILRRFGDPNILPYVHVILVFLHNMTSSPEAMAHLAPTFPWKLISLTLNTLLGSCTTYTRIECERFPEPGKDDFPRPLPEDYALRGLLWAERYFPAEWFMTKVEDEEKTLEVASMGEERKIRCLYLGYRIAQQGGQWLQYDGENHKFSANAQFDDPLETAPVAPAESVEFGDLPDATTTH